MRKIKNKLLPTLMILSILSFSAIAFVPSAIAAPATFTVNVNTDEGDANPGDGICETVNVGECTLRASIEEANANEGADTIEFNIPTSGVITFTPATPFPFISDEVSINGYTQSGASANTAVSPNPINSVIMLEIDGTNAASSEAGGFVFVPGSDGSSVRGFSVYNFGHLTGNTPDGTNVGMYASNITVAGNFIGLHADGITIATGSNDVGISFGSPFGAITGGTIGGSLPADRNIMYQFSQSNLGGTITGSSDGAVIYGNYIGIARDGVTDFTPGAVDVEGLQGPYSFGMNITTNNNQGGVRVGGASTGQANLVSGTTANVIISSPNNVVQGNLIGTDYTGAVNSGITNGMGMTITAGSDSLVGGVNPGEGNTIAGVAGSGISISQFHLENIDGNGNSYDVIPSNIAILGNSIYDISVFDFAAFGDMNQAIDQNTFIDSSDPADFRPDSVIGQGPTANDVGDSDNGANGLLNTPVLHSAQQVGQNLNVSFDLDVADSPTDQYRVEFFANDRATIFGYGPGQTYLGSTNTSSGDDKTATITLGAFDVVGKSLSATVTVIDSAFPGNQGFGATSEFAQNISVGSSADFDSDGVSDIVENAAPNNGDGNGDGIQDYLQSIVTSYTIPNSTVYATFVTNGCSENGTVSSLSESNFVATDGNYEYPFGLTDFSLNCSRGATVDVTKFVHVPDSADGLTVRKYRPETAEHFLAVPDSTVTNQTVGGEPVLVLNYQLTDGGALDDDGIANGVIVDPVGIARVAVASQQITTPTGGNTGSTAGANGNGNGQGTKSANGTLSRTGANSSYLANIAFAILLSGFAISVFSKFKLNKENF